jgi:hypothetical protein
MWCFWPLQRLQPLPFNRETPPLQPHVFKIKHLHPIFSINLHNMLFLVSQHYSFSHYAVWVDTFKLLNVELQASKSRKNGSNWKICTPSTKSRWSQATLMSELLRWSHESDQLNQPWQRHLFVENHLTFSCAPI